MKRPQVMQVGDVVIARARRNGRLEDCACLFCMPVPLEVLDLTGDGRRIRLKTGTFDADRFRIYRKRPKPTTVYL